MPHSTWTWQRTTASVVAVLLGLRLLPEVLTSFRGSFDPFALLFLAVPMLLLFGCVLFVFAGHRPIGRQVLRFAALGAAAVGAIGFVAGFVGPMIFMPDANQGPLIGIFFTAPLGLILGAVGGAIVGVFRESPPMGSNDDQGAA